ncbi:hypothetical protein [Tuwongella immobilis]|uniref:Uncharacterized protein n=1 Tax=Tuwongella immobilis TaxID=692036 RepID=A0A6C2YLI0_9BACT|nr:hypothetical protein [Tuwongella immobilis]VIP01772.1 unnamed protein product [Tuwongella immobilis]VTR99403.1 unnamed protein product [Tuwongella immobilis]
MSRDIHIGYRFTDDGPETAIEVRAPYFLFGTPATSKQFWSLPRLREVGITQLTELGVADPVYFVGWDMMAELRREIGLLQEHLPGIDFDLDCKAWFLAHLVYCYSLLVFTAPPDSTPVLTIG